MATDYESECTVYKARVQIYTYALRTSENGQSLFVKPQNIPGKHSPFYLNKWQILFFFLARTVVQYTVQYNAIWYNNTTNSPQKYLFCRADSPPLWHIISVTETRYCMPIQLDCVILNKFLLFCPSPVSRQINKSANKLPGYCSRWHSNERR